MVILTWLINIMAFTSSISALIVLPFLYRRNRNRGVIQLLILILLIALLYGAGLITTISNSGMELPKPDYNPQIFTLFIYLVQGFLLPGVLRDLLYVKGYRFYYFSVSLFLSLVFVPYLLFDSNLVVFILWNLFQLSMMTLSMLILITYINIIPEQIRNRVKILSYIFLLLLFPLSVAEDFFAITGLIQANNFIEAFTFMLLMLSISLFSVIFLTSKRKQLTKKELAKRVSLTEREYEIFLHILDNRQNKEIADLLNISSETVKSHVSKILKKVGVKRRSEIQYLIES